MEEKLTYDDLKLGELAKEAYENGAPVEEIIKLPTYLNTRHVFLNLNVTDLGRAADIAGLNRMMIGRPGTGKSQWLRDTYNRYFGGNIADGGQGIFIRCRQDMDVYNEVLTKLNVKEADREKTKNIDALIYGGDELNRAPTIEQNQLFPLGDGIFDVKGRSMTLGREGYHIFIATANVGNGDYKGTFEIDLGFYDRIPVIIDLNYSMYQPTDEEEMLIDKIKAANPKIKECEPADISTKILAANKEISRQLVNPGIEFWAVINYLRFGLRNCMEESGKRKEKNWYDKCRTCEKNPDEETLCSLIEAPARRMQNSIIRYAAALNYLAKLKDENVKVNAVDLVFKAFEITGAYQFLLNPHILKSRYQGQNPKMMADVVSKLKEDFRANEDFIMASAEEAERGKEVTRFFKKKNDKGEDVIGNYDDENLDDKVRAKFEPIEPYKGERPVRLGWMPIFIKVNKKK